MAISNLSSGFRPGVCTSTTRPTNPFNGQVIYETDSKQTLVWQGTTWVMLTDADTPPGLQLVKSQTVGSGVSSVAVADAFSSEWENYRITLSGGTISAGAQIWIQLGSSTTGYYGTLIYSDATVGSALVATDNNNSRSNWIGGGSAGNQAHLNVDLFGPQLASHTKIRNGMYQANTAYGTYNGEHRVATSYTGFTIGTESGTLTGGTIRVYGYRN